MKIAVAGKGGVGKTTLAGLLARALAEDGARVLAVDADPVPSLGVALGVPRERLDEIVPIAEMKELVEERTGAEPGSYGSYFRLNPRVDDLPDRFRIRHRGVDLLHVGGVEAGGAGCVCPEGALLRALVRHVLLDRDEVVLLDLYAGVEHLGRATADSVDAMLVVAEPTRTALATADRIRELASEIGIPEVYLVGNKVTGPGDRAFVASQSPALPVVGHLPSDPAVRKADRGGKAVWQEAPRLRSAAEEVLGELTARVAGRPTPDR